MFIAFEVSRPFQSKPFKHSEYTGTAVGWAWFGVWFGQKAIGDALVTSCKNTIKEQMEGTDSVTYYRDPDSSLRSDTRTGKANTDE